MSKRAAFRCWFRGHHEAATCGNGVGECLCGALRCYCPGIGNRWLSRVKVSGEEWVMLVCVLSLLVALGFAARHAWWRINERADHLRVLETCCERGPK